MQWYYGSNNTQFGPVPESEIQRRLQSGELRLTDMVWREGMADWVSCASVPEFAMFRAPAGPVGGAFVSPYAPPQFQGGAYPVKSNSSLAVGSLVMGILGLLLCQLLSIGGVICGHIWP